MNNCKNNRILIISTEGNIFNNPSLKCIIDLLLESGFLIDLRYPKTYASLPIIKNINYLSYKKFYKRIKSLIFNRLCSQLLANISVFMENILLYKKYSLIIGVDRQGLLEANILNKLSGTPYIFVSFEIMFESETSTKYKLLEKNTSRNVAHWVIQDEVRAKILKQENDLQDLNKIILPLASAGVGDTSLVRLRDHLGVPNDKKVAIVIGSLASWSMTSDILNSVKNWPEDWVLIINERHGRARELLNDELTGLQVLLGKKIFINDSASDTIDDMSYILSGVDVGLAFYEPDYSHIYTGDNIKYLGMASGKISTYLRYGVPVIANEIGLYADEIQNYNLGYIVTDPDDISEKLRQLKKIDHETDVYKYFINKLDFNLYSDDILETIRSVIETDIDE